MPVQSAFAVMEQMEAVTVPTGCVVKAAHLAKLISTDQNKYWRLLQRRVSERHVSEAVSFLRSHDLDPILIKGWAAARFYADPSERYFTDIDLVVPFEDCKKAKGILKRFRGGLAVDLHCGIRHLDSLSFENLFEKSTIVDCENVPVRILSAEDHLRVLCVHWLTDGGANQKRLWDIYYAVANRPANFDWERCLKVVSETRQRWIVCTIALAHKYMGLPLDGTPFADKLPEIPGWITKTVEKEWQSAETLMPLLSCLNDKRKLWRQIKRRLPPNPIQATIDMEGEFNDQSRLPYQIGDIWLRFGLSLRRTFEEYRSRHKNYD